MTTIYNMADNTNNNAIFIFTPEKLIILFDIFNDDSRFREISEVEILINNVNNVINNNNYQIITDNLIIYEIDKILHFIFRNFFDEPVKSLLILLPIADYEAQLKDANDFETLKIKEAIDSLDEIF